MCVGMRDLLGGASRETLYPRGSASYPAPAPQRHTEVVSTEAALKRAFAWLAEFDTSEDDPELFAQMRGEWEEMAREYDVEMSAFRRSCIAVLEVMHDMVTDPPPLFTDSGAILGAQALYATLIRGVFGAEYARWRRPD